MVIRKGSIYWVDFSPGKGSEPIGRRPGLVIQNDILNDSKLNTVIMLAITSTMKFGELPGNVILRKSEANLPKKCVINITQIKSVDKTSIKEKIGTLSKRKMDEVYEGLKLVLTIPPQDYAKALDEMRKDAWKNHRQGESAQLRDL
jgi:mRNA interferase MazF